MVGRSGEAFLQPLKPAELHSFDQDGLALIGSDASKPNCRHLREFVSDFNKQHMKSGVDPVSTIAWLNAKTLMECR
jgi:hypothetical protein